MYFLIFLCGLTFWGGLAFFAARKALRQYEAGGFSNFIDAVGRKGKWIFYASALGAAGLAVLLVYLESQRIAAHESPIGVLFVPAVFGAAVTGISIAGLKPWIKS